MKIPKKYKNNRIPGFKNYIIFKDGRVVVRKKFDNYEEGDIIPYSKKFEIELFSDTTKTYEKLNLITLLADIFIGHIDLPIMISYDKKGILQYDYNIKYANIEVVNDDIILINKIPFKRICSGYEYYMNAEGMIYSNVLKGGFLKRTFNQKGYLRVGKIFTDKQSNELHVLVYKLYNDNNTTGMTIDHIDGNKLNNHYSNLELVSDVENIRRGYLKGTRDDIKWNEITRHHICKMMQDGLNSTDIAKELNITDRKEILRIHVLCCNLRAGKIWPETASQYDFSKYDKSKHATKLVQSDADNIYVLGSIYKLPISYIAKKYNISTKSVRRIIDGKTFKNHKPCIIDILTQDVS